MIKKRIATFDVDSQKGFTPICPNELPVPEGDTIGVELNRMAELGMIRVGSKDWHSIHAVWIADDTHPQFTPISNENNCDMYWNSHCIGGTIGSESLGNLPAPTDYDYFVWKGMESEIHPYGACYHDLNEKLSTGVIEFLECSMIDTVLVGGLATDYCVATTVKQLIKAGFEVVLYLPACRGIDVTTSDQAVKEMESKGVVIANTFDELKGIVDN